MVAPGVINDERRLQVNTGIAPILSPTERAEHIAGRISLVEKKEKLPQDGADSKSGRGHAYGTFSHDMPHRGLVSCFSLTTVLIPALGVWRYERDPDHQMVLQAGVG